jgi:hypothetical protein
MCSFSSIRLSDSRSATSRLIRSAWVAMMSRKRSRALGSSRAWPFSVSMKPVSEASGVLQLVAGVGQEVDAHQLHAPHVGLVAQHQQGQAPGRRRRAGDGSGRASAASGRPPRNSRWSGDRPPNRASSTASSTAGIAQGRDQQGALALDAQQVAGGGVGQTTRRPAMSSASPPDTTSTGSARASNAVQQGRGRRDGGRRGLHLRAEPRPPVRSPVGSRTRWRPRRSGPDRSAKAPVRAGRPRRSGSPRPPDRRSSRPSTVATTPSARRAKGTDRMT